MTPLLLFLHSADSYLAIGLMLVAALHGIRSHLRHPAYLSRSYQTLLIAGATVLALQVVLGVSLLVSGLRPSDILHIVIYGALSPLILPGAYMYTRGQGKGHPNLAFGLVCLFLAGFLIRGTFTG
jgi:hypothetical protein